MKKIDVLVTGGAGYIGSHTLVELHNSGYRPIIVDNLSNTSLENIKGAEKIIKNKNNEKYIKSNLLKLVQIGSQFKEFKIMRSAFFDFCLCWAFTNSFVVSNAKPIVS